MATVTKREIATQVSRTTGLTRQQVLDVIHLSLGMIATALVDGRSVEIRHFGVLRTKVARPSVGRNPKNPFEAIIIPQRVVVKFAPSKELKAMVDPTHPSVKGMAVASWRSAIMGEDGEDEDGEYEDDD